MLKYGRLDSQIPIETMARWFFSFMVFVYLFFLNSYDLLAGYTCTRAHP